MLPSRPVTTVTASAVPSVTVRSWDHKIRTGSEKLIETGVSALPIDVNAIVGRLGEPNCSTFVDAVTLAIVGDTFGTPYWAGIAPQLAMSEVVVRFSGAPLRVVSV